MKKLIFLCLSAILCTSVVFSQKQNTPPRRAVVKIEKEDYSKHPSTKSKEGFLEYRMLFEFPIRKDSAAFLAFSANWVVENCPVEKVQIFVRFKTEQAAWEEWQLLETDPHAKTDVRRKVSTLMFLEKDYNFLEIKTILPPSNCLPEQVQLHFYNPGISHKTGSSGGGGNVRSLCQCPLPEHLTRADWCPTGDCPPSPNPTSTDVTHLIVHHTATPNSANDWAAVVRAIWDFHVNTRGWADIGYNWLIDPDGLLYQGRGNNVLGAHFCGTNTNTMGSAVIGEFTNVGPTNLAKNTLVALLSWKACDKDIDPQGLAWHPASGLTLHNVVGHRDGCATLCPGDSFYPQIPSIRQAIVNLIENECSSPVAAPTNLNGTGVTPTQIDLTWQDNATDEDSYVLERSFAINTQYAILATLPPDTESFQDTTVMPNAGYFYRVKAIRDSLESFYSNEEWVGTGVTAVQDLFLNNRTLRLFPNPTDGELKGVLENDLMLPFYINITDTHSRSVLKREAIEKSKEQVEFSLDLNELTAGIYWLIFQQGEAKTVRKIIKE